MCRPLKKHDSGYARTISDFGWNVTFKKSPGLLCPRVELRSALIAEYQDMWPVSVLCEGLDVSRSGFYEYLPRHAQESGDAEEAAL